MGRTRLGFVLFFAAFVVIVRGQGRSPAAPATGVSFRLVEATIPQMRDAIAAGRLTSRQLVAQYLARLGMYEDRLHAAIVVNPRALEEAAERDRERAQGRIRGPLH